MAETYRTTLKLRRGFAEVWERNNPVLQEGEPGYALDTKVLKIGDGVTPWLELKGIDSSDENYDDIISELESKMIGKPGSGQNGEIFNDTNNQATGNYSHAEGLTTKAKGNVSHVEGESTIAYTTGSHAEGKSTQAGGKSASDVNSHNGSYAHAEGVNTIAYARGSHAEGDSTLANNQYSHAEGGGCQAYGDYSHAEGCNSGNISTTTYSKAAHAEGIGTWARGEGSHTEGKDTQTTKNYAHAEGEGTVAGGIASHSEGKGTKATGDYQHAQGKYNVEDTENKYAHIVGGGTESARKNIHTLDWKGNAWFAGGFKISGTGPDDARALSVLTTADIPSIVQAVIAALPSYNKEVTD